MGKITYTAITPLTPNFIKLNRGYGKIAEDCAPIEAFTDAQLKEIGQNWTTNLIEKARKKRKHY